ncbi:MAG: UDP-N-acetylmuramate dehydrogenase [Johnsonella sp.]|nr:UDP-N-acetylmuramate dehydrogenase [Johnsonella sp.]
MKLIDELRRELGSGKIYENEAMSGHTTFEVGGPADVLVKPVSEEEIRSLIGICRRRQIPYFILGKGSNILVSDKGYRGMVISLTEYRERLEIEGELLRCSSGYHLSEVSSAAAEASLSGMEFACGIPGSVGGAVYMNAGAYGSEIKNVLRRVKILEAEGRILWVDADHLALDYRSSNIAELNRIVLEAEFLLERGEKEKIYVLMEDLQSRRSSKQPLEYPSSGSTFKRPKGYFAGQLIDEAGLRGYRIGNAMVSSKHCGFVINTGGASAAEIYALINEVKRIVKEKRGVDLVPEVKMLGDFS